MVANDCQFSKPMLVLRDCWISTETFKCHGADGMSEVEPKSYLLRGHLHQQATNAMTSTVYHDSQIHHQI